MATVHLVVGACSCVLNLAAGALGAWRWYRVDPSPLFWRAAARRPGRDRRCRSCSARCCSRSATSRRQPAHPLRRAAARGRRSSPSSCGSAPPTPSSPPAATSPPRRSASCPRPSSASSCSSIVRREMGVMALSCFVVVALAIRAATTSGGVVRRLARALDRGLACHGRRCRRAARLDWGRQHRRRDRAAPSTRSAGSSPLLDSSIAATQS